MRLGSFLAGALLGAMFARSGTTSGNASVRNGTRETLVVAPGDSLLPAYATSTDPTLFKYVNGRIVIKRCGNGSVYMRTWRRGVQATADTITLLCPAPLSLATSLCDTLLMQYHNTYPDTSVDVTKYPPEIRSACHFPP